MTPTASKLARCLVFFFVFAFGAMVVDTHQHAHAQDAGVADGAEDAKDAKDAKDGKDAKEKPDTEKPAATEPAAGDKKDKPPEKGIEAARRRMEKGQLLFSQGHYHKAMLEFEAAYKAMQFGAFLYNAAFAAEKAGDRQRAIAHYREFLASDPGSPDADKIKATIERLKEELSNLPPVTSGGGGAGGAEPSDGGQAGGGTPAKATAPVPADEATMAGIRSLVLVESDPVGAPLVIYERLVATAAPFDSKGKNPGWR